MKKVSSVFLMLACSLVFSNASFGKSQEPPTEISKSKPFEILYSETLPEVALKAAESSPLDESSNAPFLTWSFDAFGKPFYLFLETNTRLIAKIPTQKRAHIEQSLMFYRGTLEGIPGSWLRLTRVGRQWSGVIWDGQEAYIIDPLSVIAPALKTVPAQPSSEHAIYRLSDTRDLGNRTCGLGESGGVPAHPMTSFGALLEELQDRVGVTAQGATRNIDMTVVTDQQFNNANSNPDAAVIARMNVVDGIFSEQLGVQISLVNVLPLQNNGGLTSSNAGILLDQFSNFTSSSSFNHPGLAHLFTGRNLDGSTVGIAFLRSLCSARFGIGVDQITGTGTAGALTVAHELGHNFGAPHDNQNGSPCATTPGTFLMNPFLNGNDQFSPCSLSQIQPVINGATCLTFINVQQADLQPQFQTIPQQVSLGQPFSSVLSVTNIGQNSTFNASAAISTPNELSLENVITNGGNCTGIGTTQANCSLNTISPGEERQITLTLKGTSIGSFTLQATVSADNDPNFSNNNTQGSITVVSGPPPIITPTPSATLTTTSVTFTGGHTSQDLEHWLEIGTTVGAANLYQSGTMGTAHTRAVSGLPTSGTIYVRYWTRNSSGWSKQDHSYTMNAGGGGGGGTFPPAMSSPVPNATLTTTSVTFTGGHTSQDLEHWLEIGTTVGAANLYQSGTMGTAHTRAVSGLPTSGTIYVRYWTRNSSGWSKQDHSYTMNAGGGGGGGTFPPAMSSPVPNATLTTTSVTFTGGHTSQDLEHWLEIGTTVGAANLYQSGTMGTAHTRAVSGLPTSGTIYVRYWTRNSSGWSKQDHSYTMNAGGGGN